MREKIPERFLFSSLLFATELRLDAHRIHGENARNFVTRVAYLASLIRLCVLIQLLKNYRVSGIFPSDIIHIGLILGPDSMNQSGVLIGHKF